MASLKSLLAAAFAGAVTLALGLNVARPERGFRQDFHTYLAAALTGIEQGWGDIYDQANVAFVQDRLDPHLWSQPFLSTPPVAWLAALFTPLPYDAAYYAWAALTLGALAGAFAWSSPYGGPARWLAAAAALVPWWVIHSIHVGQVSPLLAAAVLVAWRLLREDRNVAAGLVLAVLMLKPNTAVFVPVALLVTGRRKALFAWLGGAGALGLASLASLGAGGAGDYLDALAGVTGPELRGASHLTLTALLGLSPFASWLVRAMVAAAGLAAMYRYRRRPGMALALGAVLSLLTTNYLHGSDLCLFGAAGWIAWHERPDPAWRALLAGIWVLATPFLDGSVFAPALDRWVICEVVVLAAFVVDAWAGRPVLGSRGMPFTGWAASGGQAPA